MADPSYRIYYGKYPDLLTGQIPTEHIRSCDGLTFRIEPGKPAEPKVDKVSFTLDNLDHTGAERYGRAWFEANARSQAEGAVVPEQLFFRIELFGPGAKGFTGIVGKKSYAPWRETVTITLKDPRELIARSKARMFKAFHFEDANLLSITAVAGNHQDLDGNPLAVQALHFSAVRSPRAVRSDGEATEFSDAYTLHAGLRGLEQPSLPNPPPLDGGDTTIYTRTRYAFVQIHEITLLTRIEEEVVYWLYTLSNGKTYHYLELNITAWHANNGPYSDNGRVVPERGRFFDRDYADLSTGPLAFKLIDYNLGHDDDILLDRLDVPFGVGQLAIVPFVHGAEAIVLAGQVVLVMSSGSYFDMLDVLAEVMNKRVFGFFYANPDSADQLDTDKAPPLQRRRAFWADIMLYGWLDAKISELTVNLATQLGCYLYYNEQGKIVFHERLRHQAYLPGALPPEAFEVELADIRPLGEASEGAGFESYEIEYGDRIEINNVEGEFKRTVNVDAGGVRSEPALRTTTLAIGSYRSSDLGVPNRHLRQERKVLRYSPADPDFPGPGGGAATLAAFLPTPETQAQIIAQSWSYPTELWNIEWDLPRYPQAGIGGYFWVDWGDEKRVYLIRKITHDPDRMSCRIEAQKVGVWNG